MKEQRACLRIALARGAMHVQDPARAVLVPITATGRWYEAATLVSFPGAAGPNLS
jgi:hypothetical protein